MLWFIRDVLILEYPMERSVGFWVFGVADLLSSSCTCVFVLNGIIMSGNICGWFAGRITVSSCCAPTTL